MSKLCYCGSTLPYSECCEPLHLKNKIAATPEALMRSRFSAFCSANSDYLIATHHRSQHAENDAEELQKTIRQTTWLSLRIIDAPKYSKTEGFVEFVAFLQSSQQENSRPSQLHERSRFIQENGVWLYVDGVFLPDIKLGRNDLCWCGSQKKLKKCHSSLLL